MWPTDDESAALLGGGGITGNVAVDMSLKYGWLTQSSDALHASALADAAVPPLIIARTALGNTPSPTLTSTSNSLSAVESLELPVALRGWDFAVLDERNIVSIDAEQPQQLQPPLQRPSRGALRKTKPTKKEILQPVDDVVFNKKRKNSITGTHNKRHKIVCSKEYALSFAVGPPKIISHLDVQANSNPENLAEDTSSEFTYNDDMKNYNGILDDYDEIKTDNNENLNETFMAAARLMQAAIGLARPGSLFAPPVTKPSPDSYRNMIREDKSIPMGVVRETTNSGANQREEANPGATQSSKSLGSGGGVRKSKSSVYSCDEPECGKTFTTSGHLARHRRVHTGVRPFSCTVCNKVFSRRDNCAAHVKVHMKQRAAEATAATLVAAASLISVASSKSSDTTL